MTYRRSDSAAAGAERPVRGPAGLDRHLLVNGSVAAPFRAALVQLIHFLQ